MNFEKLLFEHYLLYLENIESNGSIINGFNSENKATVSPAGKFHVYALSASYLINALIEKRIINSESEILVLIKNVESYLKSFYFDLRNSSIEELENIKDNKTFNSLDSTSISSFYVSGNNYFLENINCVNNIFNICYENYTNELKKIQISFENYYNIEFEYNYTDDKLKPEVSFITIYIFPFYYAVLKNHSEIDYMNSRISKADKARRELYTFSENLFLSYERTLRHFLLKHPIKLIINNELNLAKNENIQSFDVSNNSKNCYIATQVYKDINHPKVQSFRNFRDDYLVKYRIGIFFINNYYKYSPTLVEFLKSYIRINNLIRFFLDILLKILPSKRNNNNSKNNSKM
jgi:hypothetical protein